MSDTNEVSTGPAPDPSPRAPRSWLSMLVWLATFAADVWSVGTSLAVRDAPIASCATAIPVPMMLAFALSAGGLLRVFLHPVNRLLVAIAALIIVGAALQFGLWMWSDAGRPLLPCGD